MIYKESIYRVVICLLLLSIFIYSGCSYAIAGDSRDKPIKNLVFLSIVFFVVVFLIGILQLFFAKIPFIGFYLKWFLRILFIIAWIAYTTMVGWLAPLIVLILLLLIAILFKQTWVFWILEIDIKKVFFSFFHRMRKTSMLLIILILLGCASSGNVTISNSLKKAIERAIQESMTHQAFIEIDKSQHIAIMPLYAPNNDASAFLINRFHAEMSNRKYSLVERKDLDRIFEQLKIQLGSEFDDATAIEIGKLENARLMVTGGIVGDRRWDLVLKITDLQTGVIKSVLIPIDYQPPYIPPPTSIEIIPTVVELSFGEKRQLTADITPSWANHSVEWRSSDTSIAIVDKSSGLVTAGRIKGSATITVSSTIDQRVSNIRQITVEPPPPNKISIIPSNTLLKYNEPQHLKLVIDPIDAISSVIWSSSDESVVIVDRTSGTITANEVYSTKTATITATSAAFSVDKNSSSSDKVSLP